MKLVTHNQYHGSDKNQGSGENNQGSGKNNQGSGENNQGSGENNQGCNYYEHYHMISIILVW